MHDYGYGYCTNSEQEQPGTRIAFSHSVIPFLANNYFNGSQVLLMKMMLSAFTYVYISFRFSMEMRMMKFLLENSSKSSLVFKRGGMQYYEMTE